MVSNFRDTLPVALQLRGRNVLVIGGDEEARDKVEKLSRTGARVTVVAERVCPELQAEARRAAIVWYARAFAPSDLQGTQLALLTDQDASLAQRLRELKQRYSFWLCALDQPAYSDLFLVSIVQRDVLQIGISSGGAAPLLARRLREGLEAGLDQRFSQFVRRFADLRASLRNLPKPERKRALLDALRGFAIEVRLRYPRSDE